MKEDSASSMLPSKQLSICWISSMTMTTWDSWYGSFVDLSDSMQLFDDNGYRALPLAKVHVSSLPLLKEAIMTLRTRGSTDFSIGMKLATEEYAQFKSDPKDII